MVWEDYYPFAPRLKYEKLDERTLLDPISHEVCPVIPETEGVRSAEHPRRLAGPRRL